jgi:LL-diaminopimelate aminotransferase
MSPVQMADRIKTLPPYPFAAIDKAREKARAEGKDIISLGIGDPDLPTPSFIVDALKIAAEDPATHRYPDYTGRLDFRAAAADFMRRRFGVSFDPATEVLALIGSKEGIAHVPLAFVNPGEHVLCPDPGYPVYAVATSFCGGISYKMPLIEDIGFLPDLAAVPEDVAENAKMMFLNYPNNPTGAVAPKAFLEQAVAFCREKKILLVYDNAYSELAFGGFKPASIFEIPGAKDIALEMHSLSKTFNMTGWRIGFACGAAPHVDGLGKIKTNVDSGAFEAIQKAAIAALSRYDDPVVMENYGVYARRRKVCEDTLERLGFRYFKSPATFYVWFAIPTSETSAQFAARVLSETGVILTPGSAFGEAGEGFMRIALTVSEQRIVEALERVGKLIGK